MNIIGKKKRTFDSIVAPLTKIEADLSSYVQEQENAVINLQEEKRVIDGNIKTAQTEKAKSAHTITKIAELLGSDFLDENEKVTDEDETVTDKSQP
jgi:hypothetical protein